VRFLAQICATLLMVAGADVYTQDIGQVFYGGVVNLSWFSVPFTVLIVLTAIVVSFGATLYPAWNASRLDPVVALRYE
jgi:ABC-type lipoprotein release transport system permease subunit